MMNKVRGGRVPGYGMLTHGRWMGSSDPPDPRRSATDLNDFETNEAFQDFTNKLNTN